MRIKCLACEVLARPLYGLAAQSPHTIDISLLPRGMHSRPGSLRTRLQSEIDAAAGTCDALVLAYGLCGQATSGLTARHTPLVLPRAHDCITLFLGSRERYAGVFDAVPGTFWYTLDSIERDDGAGTSLALGSAFEADLQAERASLVEKYGAENADYLMETMGAWQAHYQRAVLIDLGAGDTAQVEERARQEAARRGWIFERIAGDLQLLRALLNGNWNDNFLVVPPGQQVIMSYTEDLIDCQLVSQPGC